MLINVRVALEYWQHDRCTISNKRSQKRVSHLDYVDTQSRQSEGLYIWENLFALINNIHFVKRVNVLVSTFHRSMETQTIIETRGGKTDDTANISPQTICSTANFIQNPLNTSSASVEPLDRVIVSVIIGASKLSA